MATKTKQMHRKLLSMLLGLFVLQQASAQNDQRFDSSRAYGGEQAEFWRRVYDSARKTTEYQAILERQRQHALKSNSYYGRSLFSGAIHSSFGPLNAQLAAAGFSKLNELSPTVGFAFNGRTNRVLYDFGFIANLRTRAKRGDEKYTVGGGNIVRFDLGYDLVNSRAVSVYPYAGLSWRMSWVRYDRPVTENPNGALLADFAPPASTMARSSRIGYQAGLGIDVRITQSKDQLHNVYLFAKGGVAGSFGGEKYRTGGPVYRPGITPNDWDVQIGFKFVRRR